MWRKKLYDFGRHLLQEERSEATIEKYTRDTQHFIGWLEKRSLEKEIVIQYKEHLASEYAPASVNSMLAAINGFLDFIGRGECRVKTLKIQRKVFCAQEKELSKAEYLRLLEAANRTNHQRIALIMQTICSTGIRVSELRFITAEAVRKGVAEVRSKGKSRPVLLPKQLCSLLAEYTIQKKIESGPVFVTRSGRPIDRSNVWAQMKKLCDDAHVSPSKVFPHNLRHLFARTFYGVEKDLCHLADLLGHSSVDTTRIYTMTTGAEQLAQLDSLGLLSPCKSA